MPVAGPFDDPAPTIWIIEEAPIIAPALVARLAELAARRRATLAAVIFAATAVAFSPWTGDALRIGVICADRFDPAFQSVVGPVVNLVPLRIPLMPSFSFTDVLDHTAEGWLGALRHHVPLPVLCGLAGTENMHSSRIHDVCVNVLSPVPRPSAEIPGRSGKRVTIAPHTMMTQPRGRRAGRVPQGGFPAGIDAALDIGGALHLAVGADPRVLPRQGAAALAEHIAQVLTRLAHAPHDAIRHSVTGRRPIAGLDDRRSA